MVKVVIFFTVPLFKQKTKTRKFVRERIMKED